MTNTEEQKFTVFTMDIIIEKCLNEILDGKVKEYPMLYLLNVYYQDYISAIRDKQENENAYPLELSLPLIDRESGIYEAIENLCIRKVNFDEGDFYNPLMVAVAEADASMTEYLIIHGSDPGYWIDKEDNELPPWNYYYEDIDMAYLNERWDRDERFVSALLKTAMILSTSGNLGDFSGLCLKVDTKKNDITLSNMALRY